MDYVDLINSVSVYCSYYCLICLVAHSVEQQEANAFDVHGLKELVPMCLSSRLRYNPCYRKTLFTRADLGHTGEIIAVYTCTDTFTANALMIFIDGLINRH